ncbi:hypothetical protein [Photobacterium sp.]|uniref:hypothetical protein n=1 Tax=Photobacterium sp. TaxID=660 RepID=UPI00299E6E72|nr:hypothetical protein [Photobacterium sp.]MDX1300919.1 hypothetical protein [Photobacterium sp.]
MMNYLAVFLNSGGGVVRNEETQEVMNLQLGEYPSADIAIEHACEQLNCKHVLNGVLVKGQDKGGFMIVDAQEFVSL